MRKTKLVAIIVVTFVISLVSSISLADAVVSQCGISPLPSPKAVWRVVCDLQSQITGLNNSLSAETTARIAGDSSLQTQIDAIAQPFPFVYTKTSTVRTVPALSDSDGIIECNSGDVAISWGFIDPSASKMMYQAALTPSEETESPTGFYFALHNPDSVSHDFIGKVVCADLTP